MKVILLVLCLAVPLVAMRMRLNNKVGHENKTDCEIISTIGSSSSLFGIAFGLPLRNTLLNAPFPVLAEPKKCKLLMPSSPYEYFSEQLSSEEAATTYQSVSRASGRSLSVSFKASGWGFHVSGGISTAEQRKQEQVSDSSSKRTSSSSIVVQYVPMRTFRIPRDQMFLSTEAVFRARNVKDLTSAKYFLLDFHSHVSSGVVTIGGSYTRQATVVSSEISSSQALRIKASDSLNVRFEAGGGGLGFSGEVATRYDSFTDLDENGKSTGVNRSCLVRTSVTANGPSEVDPKVFVQELKKDPSTWRIIDRGDERSLVPVWELMFNHTEKEVQVAGNFVRDAWLYMAMQLYDISIVKEAFDKTIFEGGLNASNYLPDQKVWRNARFNEDYFEYKYKYFSPPQFRVINGRVEMRGSLFVKGSGALPYRVPILFDLPTPYSWCHLVGRRLGYSIDVPGILGFTIDSRRTLSTGDSSQSGSANGGDIIFFDNVFYSVWEI